MKPLRLPSSSYVPTPEVEPISWNVPGSHMAAKRSRTVSLPAARWRATRSAPPISAASARAVELLDLRQPAHRG